MVVRHVHQMVQRFAPVLNPEHTMTIRVARGRLKGDRTVQDLVAVSMLLEIWLKNIEGATYIADHVWDVVPTMRFGEVGFCRAPEVDFRLHHSQRGIRIDEPTLADESADMVGMTVAEDRAGHLLGRNAD